MNVNQVVKTSWNLGTAMSEMIGSFVLVFLVFTFTYFIKKFLNSKYNFIILSFSYVLAFFVAIILAWILGGFINGLGQAAGLITPLSIIATSFIKNVFISLPYVISFQIIGGILGSFMFLFFVYLYQFILIKDNSKIEFKKNILLVIDYQELNFSKFSIKEIIFQFLFTFTLPFIGYIDQITYGVETINVVIISLLIAFVLLLLSSKIGFFMFALNISIATLILQAIFKIFTWKKLCKFLIAISIQIFFLYASTSLAKLIAELNGNRIFDL